MMVKQPFKLFENIKKARVSSGLSQKDLAKKLGVSDKTVSAYETGRAIPPTPTLAKISAITGKTLSEILGTKRETSKDEISERLKKIEERISYLGPAMGSSSRLKLDAFVGVVLKDEKDRIYLIKEEDKYQISKERWNLPGGSVDKDEGLIEAAIRESQEKTGFNIIVNSLLGSYKCKKGSNSWIYIVFEARLAGKSSEAIDPSVKDGKWFTKDKFTKLDINKLVHPDMHLVHSISQKNRGLAIDSVKFIDYDEE